MRLIRDPWFPIRAAAIPEHEELSLLGMYWRLPTGDPRFEVRRRGRDERNCASLPGVPRSCRQGGSIVAIAGPPQQLKAHADLPQRVLKLLWHRLVGTPGGPASESGTLCYVDGSHERGDGRRRVLKLPTLSLTKILRGGAPGLEGSTSKLFWSQVDQELAPVATEVIGPYSQTAGESSWAPDDGQWEFYELLARASGIRAGTSEILRNILAERVLGLPKD